MLRTHNCNSLNSSHINEQVTLTGWVQKTRDLGGMTLSLRDRYGITQITFNMQENADLCLFARKLGREFVIQVTGTVIERSSKNKNLPLVILRLKLVSYSIKQIKNSSFYY